MRQLGRPHGVALVSLLTVVGSVLLPAPPSGATAGRVAQVAGSLDVSADTVDPGAPVTLSGTLPPRHARTVKLQVRRGDDWSVLDTKRSSRRGVFRFVTTAASKPSTRDYRVLAPATTIGGTRHRAVITPTRSVTVATMTAVASGWRHNCALGSNGRAWCWGSNQYGELGDGTGASGAGTQVSDPVQVLGKRWTDISAAGASTCGLKADDTAWCWGDGASYMFSGGGSYNAPTQLPGAWSQLSAGWFYACGVHTDGTGWCRGWDQGQLGTGDPVSSGTDVQVPGSWLQIVASDDSDSPTTCGIKTDRSAWCWGDGTSGQLGNDASSSSATPVAVAGEHAWASLTVGTAHTCGIDTDGHAWCWGTNTEGRLGDGGFADRDVPSRVAVADTWTSLDVGLQHTCGVTTDGQGWCWGWNNQGQLGDGTDETSYPPSQPKYHHLPGTWRDLGAGYLGSSGTRANGSQWAWGEGVYGQLGHGSADASFVPVDVDVLR